MSAIKNKIRSSRGASITFALLIFLVCSVISIVVVVAGSAAAGRMSQRADIDRRYYAVSSAMQLLCDDFEKKTVEVKYSKEKGASASIVVNTDNIIQIYNSDTPTYTYAAIDYGILAEVSAKLVEKIANNTPAGNDPDHTFELTTSLDDDKAALDCTINDYVYRDGRLVFVVSNATAAATDPKYTLQATFTASISVSSTEYTDTTSGKTMQDVTTTVEWKFGGIKKGA